MIAIEKLRCRMKQDDIDAILINDEVNSRYLSGFLYHDGAFLLTQSEAHILTDFRYYEAAKNQTDGRITVTQTKERKKYILEVLSSCSARRIGFLGASVSFKDYKQLALDFSDFELIDIGNIIDEIRAIKSDYEIECISKAQQIADKAFEVLLGRISLNMTEIEVAAEIDYLIRRGGAEGSAFDTIAVSGDASSVPHGVPRNVKLNRGFLTMDFGAKVNGYCSDMTRTVVIGKADADMKHLYSTVLEAQRAALDFIKAGIIASEADSVARKIIESHQKYKNAFGHSLGHSLGLNVHESPSLSPKNSKTILRAGNIVTVEPGIYLEGKYGCRIEDLVLVLDNGIRNFTKSTKDLIEIY